MYRGISRPFGRRRGSVHLVSAMAAVKFWVFRFRWRQWIENFDFSVVNCGGRTGTETVSGSAKRTIEGMTTSARTENSTFLITMSRSTSAGM